MARIPLVTRDQIVEKEKCAACHLGASNGQFYLHHVDPGRSLYDVTHSQMQQLIGLVETPAIAPRAGPISRRACAATRGPRAR